MIAVQHWVGQGAKPGLHGERILVARHGEVPRYQSLHGFIHRVEQRSIHPLHNGNHAVAVKPRFGGRTTAYGVHFTLNVLERANGK